MPKSLVKKTTESEVAEKKTVKPKVKKVGLKASTSKKVKSIVFRSDSRQTSALQKMGREAASGAIRASKALELSICYLEKGILIKEYPDGKKEILPSGTKRKASSKKSTVQIKKGLVLHAKS